MKDSAAWSQLISQELVVAYFMLLSQKLLSDTKKNR
jgi:hypothetical protein